MAVRYNQTIIVAFMVILFGDTRALSIANEKSYDTIVVGLGSAGTTAASTLARAGRRVLALEAQDRVGGRVKTVPFGDGVVEEGAEWIHGTHPSRIYDLAVQNNISLTEDVLNIQVYKAGGKPFNESLVKELTLFCLEGLDDAAKKHESVEQYVTRSLMSYLNKNYPDVAKDSQFIKEFLRMMNSMRSIDDASYSWAEVLANSTATELEGNGITSWHRHGYKTFFELLLNTYNNGPGLPSLDIKLNKEVTLIKWPRDSTGPIQVTCRDGDHYTASNVIVTVSLGVLKERYSTLFEPELPSEKITAIDKISMGVLGKIILSFSDVWWPKTPPINPLILFWDEEEIEKLGMSDKWMSTIYGTSFPTGSNNTFTLWTHGEAAKFMETLAEDVLKNNTVELLRKFLGKNYTIPEPIGIIRSTWFTNPYTRGAYSYDSLIMTQYPTARATLAEPLLDEAGSPKVLFAGEATNPAHYATVHGASDSGYRAAMRLLSANKA